MSDFLFIGKDAVVFPLAKIVFPETVFIDDHAVVSDFCFILGKKFVKIGKYSHLAPYAMITGGGEVYIQDFVDISYAVKIISGTDDIFGDSLFTPSVPANLRKVKRSTVEINNFAFIGANSLIYPGVKIGEGAIVNPGTIVRKNLDSWTVYDGQECLPVGKRKYREEIIRKAEQLVELRKK
ncbi:MAG: acyltransferase [Ignavibacteriales bacterium]|nr:MAG: acyltransferase [Ignavibacteriales bacterium]